SNSARAELRSLREPMAETIFVSLAMAVPLPLSGHTMMLPMIAAGGIGWWADLTLVEACCVVLVVLFVLSGGRRACRAACLTSARQACSLTALPACRQASPAAGEGTRCSTSELPDESGQMSPQARARPPRLVRHLLPGIRWWPRPGLRFRTNR